MKFSALFTTAAVLAALTLPAQAGSLVDLGNSNAQAQSQQQGQAQGQLQGQHQSSTNVNVNDNHSHSSSRSNAVSGSISGAAAVNRGNSFSSSTSVDASDDIDAEPAYAPNVNLTSSGCIGSIGGSGGGMGLFSVGFATTMESRDCFKLEAAKIYLSMGDKAKAVAVMESVSYIGEAVGMKTAAAVPGGATGLGSGATLTSMYGLPAKGSASLAGTIEAPVVVAAKTQPFEIPLECTLGLKDCTKD